MEQETIICAAIHYKNGRKYKHQPTNITNGKVFSGGDMWECMRLFKRAFPEHSPSWRVGHITSNGRFVGWWLGEVIARKAGQSIDTKSLKLLTIKN